MERTLATHCDLGDDDGHRARAIATCSGIDDARVTSSDHDDCDGACSVGDCGGCHDRAGYVSATASGIETTSGAGNVTFKTPNETQKDASGESVCTYLTMMHGWQWVRRGAPTQK
ncbi:hypothetical protein PsorP6_014560 [Peronosclerospora sorghi]|uniref:Uncharacterized protein n=1 Tax=Peronosclerospora sorghi TaxID=230839 RepID=A0ACC0VS09_9STRA|nr:hypothetical protein PsorP6_014560 [Peronosclerospora sorghi]